jgi:hypothetical protein
MELTRRRCVIPGVEAVSASSWHERSVGCDGQGRGSLRSAFVGGRVARRFLTVLACVLPVAGCAPAVWHPVAVPTVGASTQSAAPGSITPRPSQGASGPVRGAWSALPLSPLSPRAEAAAVVWTGRLLFVWGGATGPSAGALLNDGAVWDSSADEWRMLPPAPLSARTRASAVWTGRQVIVWGGLDHIGSHGSHVAADGAAWDPATNSWTPLSVSPLSGRADAIAAWTGEKLILLGGRPAGPTDAAREFTDGASFDPTSGTWRMLPNAVSPAGHGIEWATAVMTDHDLLAWSVWANHAQTGPGTTTGSGGGELYRYDPAADRWNAVPSAPGALADVVEAYWTGTEVVARGFASWCQCRGSALPEATSTYRPSSNTWTALPPDPLGADHQLSAWTAGGLLSFDGSGQYGSVRPGDTSTWSLATNKWARLPSAPFGCPAGDQQPSFLGGAVAWWCPQTRSGDGPDGLAFTLAPDS